MVGWKNADNYRSLLGAMKTMTDEEKVQLFDKVQKVGTPTIFGYVRVRVRANPC